jgi:hypothetical protein
MVLGTAKSMVAREKLTMPIEIRIKRFMVNRPFQKTEY